MLAFLLKRRSGWESGTPTPEQAYEALQAGRCMYALISNCSGPPASVGIRPAFDSPNVLVCKAHYGRLRRHDSRPLDKLEQALTRAFKAHEPDAADDGAESQPGMPRLLSRQPPTT